MTTNRLQDDICQAETFKPRKQKGIIKMSWKSCKDINKICISKMLHIFLMIIQNSLCQYFSDIVTLLNQLIAVFMTLFSHQHYYKIFNV